MEVGEALKEPSELKREFEEFRRRQEKERLEEATTHRGLYLCRLDASEILRGSRAPLFRAIVVQNSIDFPVGKDDSFHVQGQVGRMGMGVAHGRAGRGMYAWNDSNAHASSEMCASCLCGRWLCALHGNAQVV